MERFQCEYSTTLPRCTIMVVSKKENQVVTQSVWTAKMGRDKEKKKKEKKRNNLAFPGFDPGTSGLWARRASAALRCFFLKADYGVSNRAYCYLCTFTLNHRHSPEIVPVESLIDFSLLIDAQISFLQAEMASNDFIRSCSIYHVTVHCTVICTCPNLITC